MKRIKYIALALCAIVLMSLTGCGETPAAEIAAAEKTAKAYYQAMMDGDYEKWCEIAGGQLKEELFENMRGIWKDKDIQQYTFAYKELKGADRKEAINSHNEYAPGWYAYYGAQPNYSLSDIQNAGIIIVYAIEDDGSKTEVYWDSFVLTDQGWRLGQFAAADFMN